jgi:predicted O-linked N-acetylglucosamine transferase (SPINDLY family)
VLEAQGRILAALDAASRAAAVRPDEIAHAGLVAQLQEGLGQFAAARKTLEGAIARRPTTSALHSQLARVHELAGDFTAAAASLENALRLARTTAGALAAPVRTQATRRLAPLARSARALSQGRARRPRVDDAVFAVERSVDARRAARRRRPLERAIRDERFAGAPRSIGEGRLRIGYLSSDYYDHPTVALIAGAIEAHDRGRVEVVGYSTGHNDGSPSRARIEKAFDRFVDAAHWSPDQIAARIRADAIDILIDLKGHTAGAPTSVLARRPAPIQAHYLGYPGTLGAMFIDYLIGDSVVTPLPHAADYAEALVLLPGSYQANDRSRTAATAPSRANWGYRRTRSSSAASTTRTS